MYLSIYLSIYLYLSLYLSIHPSIHLSINQSINLSVCLSICLSVCLMSFIHYRFCAADLSRQLINLQVPKKVVFENGKLNALWYFLHLPLIGYAAELRKNWGAKKSRPLEPVLAHSCPFLWSWGKPLLLFVCEECANVDYLHHSNPLNQRKPEKQTPPPNLLTSEATILFAVQKQYSEVISNSPFLMVNVDPLDAM